MILKDFLDEATRVKDSVKIHKDLFTYLSNVTSNYEKYIQLYKKLRNSFTDNANATQQNMASVVNEITALDKAVINEIKKYDPFDLFTEFQSLISSFEKIEILKIDPNDSIQSEIKTLINLQTQAYSEKKFNEIFSFVSFCYPFLNKLDKYEFTADIFLEKLKLKQTQLPDQNHLIDIQIVSTNVTLEEFSAFLSFIDGLYQNLCKAFIIHYSEYPLNIIKIESGSIWSKLFGHEKLIDLIRDLMFGVGNYIRDLQTGKIDKERFENKVIKAGLVIDLMEKAKKSGFDAKNQILLEKVFNQSVIDIAKIIPKSTTEILIDNKCLLNLDQQETKAIEGKNPLMLNSKNDKNTSA